MKKARLILPISIIALLLCMMHCSEDDEVQDVFIRGESAKFGVGEANVWGSAFFFTGRDSIVSIGLNVPLKIIVNTEQNETDTVLLNFPDVVRENTAMQFVEAMWPSTVNESEPFMLARFFLIGQQQASALNFTMPSTVKDTIRLGMNQNELVYYELMIKQSTLLEMSDIPLQIPETGNTLIQGNVPTEFLADYQQDDSRYALTWQEWAANQ